MIVVAQAEDQTAADCFEAVAASAKAVIGHKKKINRKPHSNWHWVASKKRGGEGIEPPKEFPFNDLANRRLSLGHPPPGYEPSR